MSPPTKQRAATMLLLLLFSVIIISVHSDSQESNFEFQTTKFRRTSEGRRQTSTSRRNTKKEVTIIAKTRRRLQRNVSSVTTFVDGVPVWSKESEMLMPEGFSDRRVRRWQEETRRLQIRTILPGQCGRSPNALVVFDDGRKACSRMRKDDNAIMGDSYSFALSRLLGTHYVPSTILSDIRTEQWRAAASYFKSYGKDVFPFVLVTEWINNAGKAYVPQILRRTHSHVRPDETLASLRSDEIRDLMQWTDMVLFDYLTVNTDRVMSMLYNELWSKGIMERPVPNLLQEKDGLLLFLDNELGLIFGQTTIEQLDVYRALHNQMLNSTCVFRLSTVERVKELSQSKDIGRTINEMLKHLDPLAKELGLLVTKYTDKLQSRIDDVYRHMKTCYNTSK